jgi:hypothetical protein
MAILQIGCSDLADRLAKRRAGPDAGDSAPAQASSAAASTATTATTITTPVPTTAPTAAKAATPGKPAAAPPSPTSPAQLEAAFAALDINRDNQLDGVEVTRCGCKSADANGDGVISKAEYLAAGLLGKLSPAPTPGPAPAPTTPPTAPTPGPQPTTPPTPPPAAGGLPPGGYNCFGLVGSAYVARGTLVIVDATRYAHGTDGSGGGNYVFDPATKKIRFTSGLFANPDSVSDAKQISPTYIQMRTGKGGFYTSRSWAGARAAESYGR